ncbi:hypothetical protein KCU91_g116, partial [Aureobasidium melanogenum]
LWPDESTTSSPHDIFFSVTSQPPSVVDRLWRVIVRLHNSLFAVSVSSRQSQSNSRKEGRPTTNTSPMCFGERTTFVCSVDGCTNKHWETKYYAFGADPDSGKCDAGNFLGTCAEPWMVYHQEEIICRGCSTRWTEESPPPPPTPVTWHPQDHTHSLPTLPTYEQFEQATLNPVMATRLSLNRTYRSTICSGSVYTPNAADPIGATTDADDVHPPPPTTPSLKGPSHRLCSTIRHCLPTIRLRVVDMLQSIPIKL